METEKEKQIEGLLKNSFLGDFLEDEGITDISFNGTSLYIQHNQKGRSKPEQQPTIEEVERLTRQIADIQDRAVTNLSPILDTEIGYIRVNFVHEIISPDGMTFSMRISRPKLNAENIESFIEGDNKDIADLIKLLVRTRNNIIISGSTGSGKTELQKLLVGYIPIEHKITLIEDTRDSHIKLLYPEKDINSWRSITDDNFEKKTTTRLLVKTSLRNNPEWVIISETRGEEASDMMDSAKTDHSIITTLHAKSAIEIVSRLIGMIVIAESKTSTDLIGKDVVRLFPFGIHMETNFVNNKIVRSIKEVVEFHDYDNGNVGFTYLYRKRKELDKTSNEYKVVEETNIVSEKTMQYLTDKEVVHLLPESFNPISKKTK